MGKHYIVYFDDITADEVVDEDYPIGTIAFDNTLKVLYVRNGGGWQFISAQV